MLANVISTICTILGALCIGAWAFLSNKSRQMTFRTRVVCAVISFVVYKIILEVVLGCMTSYVDPILDSALEILSGGFDAWH